MKPIIKFWGNVCGVGPSLNVISFHDFDWKEGDTKMECSKCGFRWDGKTRWFRLKCTIEFSNFNNVQRKISLFKPFIFPDVVIVPWRAK